jgi:hypothetical protein
MRFDEHASSPGTPSSGNVVLYAKSDGHLYQKDDVGTETDLVRPTLGTPVATTSGTSVDITGIPAGVRQITVMLDGVSITSTTDPLCLQIGDAGGIETSGYDGMVSGIESGLAVSSIRRTGSAPITNYSYAASATAFGSIIFTLLDAATFTWVWQGGIARDDTTEDINYFCAGRKSLSAELDRIRLTTVTGTDTFDAGTINIQYS